MLGVVTIPSYAAGNSPAQLHHFLEVYHVPARGLTLHAGYSPMDAQATHSLAAHVRA